MKRLDQGYRRSSTTQPVMLRDTGSRMLYNARPNTDFAVCQEEPGVER